jgi:hypothetical protein
VLSVVGLSAAQEHIERHLSARGHQSAREGQALRFERAEEHPMSCRADLERALKRKGGLSDRRARGDHDQLPTLPSRGQPGERGDGRWQAGRVHRGALEVHHQRIDGFGGGAGLRRVALAEPEERGVRLLLHLGEGARGIRRPRRERPEGFAGAATHGQVSD